ncbi:solute carrier family 2, facilitated glucose transporter member 3-like [Physella acuta]|uniref:solute carrier family 2, facilitated glucose transporter member 3-like n=1 Tax=Physella acuta TaxID=109671 RepID=UPI0027DBDA1D|nr:solute carrier family 2, facilitated glucose transporter member 3-like [Physella acuta]
MAGHYTRAKMHGAENSFTKHKLLRMSLNDGSGESDGSMEVDENKNDNEVETPFPSNKSKISEKEAKSTKVERGKKSDFKENGWTFRFLLILLTAYLVVPGIGYTMTSLNAPADLIKEFMNETKFKRDGEWMSTDAVDSLFGLLVAVVGVGSAVGSLTASIIADKFGRKLSIILASVTGLIGVLLMALCRVGSSYEMLFVGRTLTGFTLGWGLSLAPAYLVEMAVPSMRGNVALLNQLFQSFSFFLAQVMGYTELLGNEQYWHYLLGFPIIFFGLQIILLPFCPESPRYLLMNKNDTEGATRALQMIRNRKNVEEDIAMLHQELKESATEAEVSVIQLFKSPLLRRPLVTAIVMGLQQNWCGMNAILFFSTQLFKSAGLDDRNARYATSGTGLIFFLCNVFAIFLLTRFGRKTLFQMGTIGMAVCSAVIALTMLYQNEVSALRYVNIAVSLFVMVCYSLGPVCVFWVMLSELFPNSARGTGFSIAILCATLSFFSHSYIFPILLSNLHSYTFFVFCGIDVAMAIFIHFYVPETKDKTFAEIAKSWSKSTDVDLKLTDSVSVNEDIPVGTEKNSEPSPQ